MLADSLPMSMINRKGLAWVVNDTLHMPALLSLCYIHRLLDIQWQCSRPTFCEFQTAVFNQAESKLTERLLCMYVFVCFYSVPINRTCDALWLGVPFNSKLVYQFFCFLSSAKLKCCLEEFG